MTNVDEITRRLTTELGPAAAADLTSTIEGGTSPDAKTRAFGVGPSEVAAAASFGWAVVNVFLEVRTKRRDEAELLADLAAGLDADPRLVARLDPDKRLNLAARVLDKDAFNDN